MGRHEKIPPAFIDFNKPLFDKVIMSFHKVLKKKETHNEHITFTFLTTCTYFPAKASVYKNVLATRIICFYNSFVNRLIR